MQCNCAEGLHFSAFHCMCSDEIMIYSHVELAVVTGLFESGVDLISATGCTVFILQGWRLLMAIDF